MQIEVIEPTKVGDTVLPERTFIEFSAEEVKQALWKYARESDASIRDGDRLWLRLPEDVTGIYTLVIEHGRA